MPDHSALVPFLLAVLKSKPRYLLAELGVFADWLEEHGDERAKDLRAFFTPDASVIRIVGYAIYDRCGSEFGFHLHLMGGYLAREVPSLEAVLSGSSRPESEKERYGLGFYAQMIKQTLKGLFPEWATICKEREFERLRKGHAEAVKVWEATGEWPG